MQGNYTKLYIHRFSSQIRITLFLLPITDLLVDFVFLFFPFSLVGKVYYTWRSLVPQWEIL